MIEGWHINEYWTLFDSSEEAEHAAHGYGISEYLPGYRLVGLLNWDDFVIANAEGQHFKIATVPLEPKEMTPYDFQVEPKAIEWDGRFEGKIKWYVKPPVFGGDSEAKDNLAWVTPEQHVEVVRWWAEFYRENFPNKE